MEATGAEQKYMNERNRPREIIYVRALFFSNQATASLKYNNIS